MFFFVLKLTKCDIKKKREKVEYTYNVPDIRFTLSSL